MTIEDPDTLVLAYSGGQQDVDEARVRTILGRQVPAHFQDAIVATGVREHLRRSDEVFVVDLPDVRMMPRAVVALRHEGALRGSIWAAISGGPNEHQERLLRQAAPVIATQLAREHAATTDSQRRRAEVLATLLAGGEAANSAARDRGLTGPMSVVALHSDAGPPASRVAAALVLHLSALSPGAVCAAVGPAVYAVLPAGPAADLTRDFLRRYRSGHTLSAGLGITVAEAALLPRSRGCADEVATAMLRRGIRAEVGDVTGHFTALLTDSTADFFARFGRFSPLARLREHDDRHQDHLVEAVSAFLRSAEVSVAAADLAVHPNTVRNRLRRAHRECGVDVHDPDVRLALMVHLRVADRTSQPG